MGYLFDIQFAMRLLSKSPRFLILTLVVLVGGMTVSLFTFSFFHTMFYKDIPVADSHNIYRMTDDIPLYEYAQYREQFDDFETYGVWRSEKLRLIDGDNIQNVAGIVTQWNMFEFVNVQALHGRTLQPQDSEPDAPLVAMLGFGLWQSNYGGNTSIIGQTINVNSTLYTVVGITPQDLQFPQATDIWLPMNYNQLNPVSSDFETAKFHVRLKDSASLSEVSQKLNQLIMPSWIERYAQIGTEIEPDERMFFLDTYPFAIVKSDGTIEVLLVAVNIAATLILILSSVNVGNLLLARVLARAKESAVRVALGAGKHRLVSQLMWEGGIVVVVGTIISLFLTSLLLDSVTIFMGSAFGQSGTTPFWWKWSLDLHTFLAGIGFMGLTIFVACYLPALRSSKAEVSSVLRDGTRGAQGQNASKVSKLMIGFQLFFASLIMSFGGLLFVLADLGSSIDPGYEVRGLMGADIEFQEKDFDVGAVSARIDVLISRLESSEDVDEAFLWSRMGQFRGTIEGEQASDTSPTSMLSIIQHSKNFGAFKLLDGRYFDHRERQAGEDGAKSLIVSQSYVDKRFKDGERAIGKRVQMNLEGTNEWFTIVGIVDNLIFGFTEKPADEDEIYISYYQVGDLLPRIYFRANSKLSLAEGPFYEHVYSVLPEVDVKPIRYIEDSLDSIASSLEYGKKAIFFAGAFALMLALIGVYGMTANAIVEKSHEVGLRRALGATNSDIVKLFLRQSIKPLAWGCGLGLGIATLFYWAAAALIGLSLGYFIFNIALVSFSIAMIVMFAVIMPSKRAVAQEPSVALRAE